MKKCKFIVLILMCFMSVLLLVGCGNTSIEDITSQIPVIGTNGNWWVNGTDTGVKAEGQDGANGKDGTDGEDGLTPFIGTNGNWWIGETDTGVKAEGHDGIDGEPGTDGEDGLTPFIGTNGNWWIGEIDTGVTAEGYDGIDGKPGTDGEDGLTPFIGTNGNWWIGETDTGVQAEGQNGDNGTDGKSAYEIFKYYYPEYTGTEAEWIYAVATNNVCALFGHKEVTDKAVAPTCEETGLTQGKHCSVCSTILEVQDIIEPTGHNTINHDGLDATCEVAGYKEYVTCSKCNYTTYEVIPALGHTEVIDEAVSGTCESIGLTEGKHCSVCSKVLVTQIETGYNHTYEGLVCSICEHMIITQEESTKYLQFALNSDGLSYQVKVNKIYKNEVEYIYIPETYNNLPVTKISEYGFSNCTKLKKVQLPDSVIIIGDMAFDYSGLEYIYLPAYMEEIGFAAFDRSELRELEIPTGITKIECIVEDCKKLEKIYISETVAEFRSSRNCINLTTIKVSSDNEYFKVVDGILYTIDETTLVWYPAGLQESKVVVPYGVTKIYEFAFSGADKIVEVCLPSSTTNLDDDSFSNMKNLERIYLSENITKIDGNCFMGCEKLEFIELPECLEKLEHQVFHGCKNLKTVVMHNNIESIASRAFAHCTALENIYYTGTKEEWEQVVLSEDDNITPFVNVTYEYKTMIRSVVMADYARMNGWKNYEVYSSVAIDANTSIAAVSTRDTGYATTTGKWYTNNGENWRWYQTEDPEITITSTRTISNVVIEYSSHNEGIIIIGETQYESGAMINVNGNTVILGVGNSADKTGGHVRIEKITIYYAD